MPPGPNPFVSNKPSTNTEANLKSYEFGKSSINTKFNKTQDDNYIQENESIISGNLNTDDKNLNINIKRKKKKAKAYNNQNINNLNLPKDNYKIHNFKGIKTDYFVELPDSGGKVNVV